MSDDPSQHGEPPFAPQRERAPAASDAAAARDPALELYIRILAEKAEDSLDRAAAARQTTDRLVATHLERSPHLALHRIPLPSRND